MSVGRALLAVMIWWAGWVYADSTPLDTGTALFADSNYDPALRILTPLAEKGDAEAQILLGIMYAEGRGVPKNAHTAREWYKLAAEQGDPAGQFMLGLTYVSSEAATADATEAVKWIQRSAQGGNIYAQRFLAKSYRNGWIGLPRDREQSEYWLMQAGL